MLPRDSERPPYRTGDETLTGLVSFMVTMPAQLWYQGAWMDSQLSMTQAENWQQAGTVTIEDALGAANTSYVRIRTMIGTIFLWAGVTDPEFASLPCDGSVYAKADYPALYDLLQAFQIDADTFATPDMRTRVPVGTGSGYGIGDTGGEAEHTLTSLEMPSHVHIITAAVPELALEPGELPVFGINIVSPIGETDPAGGDGPHNNLQPYLALEYWIVSV